MNSKPICKFEITINFMRQLVKYLDTSADLLLIKDDPAWDNNFNWKEFNKNFNYLLPKIQNYLKDVKEGNPSLIVLNLVIYCNLSVIWAKLFIENTLIGEPCHSAYCLYNNKYVDLDWVLKIIKRCKLLNFGNALDTLFYMKNDNVISKNEYNKIKNSI